MKKQYDNYRKNLPYGKWTFDDSSEVLFNRDYEPIAFNFKSNKFVGVDSKVLNSQAKESLYFYDDGNPPWKNKKTVFKCTNILKDWDF